MPPSALGRSGQGAAHEDAALWRCNTGRQQAGRQVKRGGQQLARRHERASHLCECLALVQKIQELGDNLRNSEEGMGLRQQ
jgi:hypothetical protein